MQASGNDVCASADGLAAVEARHVLLDGNMPDILREVLELLATTRPEQPLQFLATYLVKRQTAHGTTFVDHLSETMEGLRGAPYKVAVAALSLRSEMAFGCLCSPGQQPVQASHVLKQMVESTCSDLPTEVHEALLKNIQGNQDEALTFQHFQAAVLACFTCREWSRMAGALFDEFPGAALDHHACDALVHSLWGSAAGSAPGILDTSSAGMAASLEVLRPVMKEACGSFSDLKDNKTTAVNGEERRRKERGHFVRRVLLVLASRMLLSAP
uniref:tubulin polyglutamylase complex subunit 1 n=1 Tax=Myxine glutinosa TaxID=7769 RepID=UPI00358FEE54